MTGLSITKKLIGAFGLVFAFISFFGLFILYSFNGLSSERSNVRDWLDSNVTVSKIARNINDLQRTVHIRTTANNSNRKLEQETQIKNIDSAFENYQQVIDKGDYDDPAERQRDQNILDNEVKLWQDYKNQLAKIEPFILANDREKMIAILNNDVEKSFEAINNAMNNDVEECAKGLTDAVDTSEKTFENFTQLVHILGILIALILIFVVGILYILARDINHSVKQIVSVTEKAANGDLSHEINTDATDEFGTIADQFNSVIKNTRKALEKVQIAAEQVSNSAEMMKSGVNQTGELLQNVALSVTSANENAADQEEAIKDTEERARRMKKSVDQSIFAMKAGLESVRQTAEHAGVGNEKANLTVKQMNEIAKSVAESAKIVQELGENSKEIGSIVEVISGIADQTNLLALNAAIEAARAGEQGRGFAVVADEVRKLAEGSQESVQKIGTIINKIQITTDKAVETMNKGHQLVQEGRQNVESTGSSFHEIVNMIQVAEENSTQVMQIINSLQEPIDDIVNRTEKIAKMSDEISKTMQTISIATAEQAENVVEISDKSSSLTDLSQNMKKTVHEFRL
ncbi:MAG: methyl-accepting chemotaxis protein [Selenomonadaceae bacterium]|nr:methyl-accepting chemotaxis protein [Selenomonadaceae bacterium]